MSCSDRQPNKLVFTVRSYNYLFYCYKSQCNRTKRLAETSKYLPSLPAGGRFTVVTALTSSDNDADCGNISVLDSHHLSIGTGHSSFVILQSPNVIFINHSSSVIIGDDDGAIIDGGRRPLLIMTRAIVTGPFGGSRGASTGGGPPWDLKNTTFSGFLPLNYAICIFEVRFLSFCYVGGLRKLVG